MQLTAFIITDVLLLVMLQCLSEWRQIDWNRTRR